MSDILIKGIAMPKAEFGSMIVAIRPDGMVEDVMGCYVGKAVHVPPHDRLGDLDALKERVTKRLYASNHGSMAEAYFAALIDLIDTAPTIIPADQSGDAVKKLDNDYAGLKVKYIVHKMSTGEIVDDCFVLRPDRDKAAVAALAAYADVTENQILSADIRKWLSTIIPAEEGEA